MQSYDNNNMTKHEIFEELYNSSKNKLLAIAYNMVKNKEVAEDVLQDSYVKAWKKFDEFDSSKKFMNWMTTIVRNTAIDNSRSKAKKAKPLSIENSVLVDNKTVPISVLDESQDVSRIHERNELIKLLQLAIDSLPSELNTVMTPLAMGHSYAEIATMNDISVSTVRARVHRAKQILRKNQYLVSFF